MAKNTLAVVSDETKQRLAVIDQMNADLRKEFEEIAEETKKAAHSNVMFYHKLGERAKKIHADTHKYGEGAVEKLATALTIDRGLVYKAMRFAELWKRDEMKALMERQTSGSNYITWTHIAQLVHVEDRKQLDELVEVIFEKDLSVRDLRDELKRRLYSGAAAGRQATPRTAMGGLSQMVTMTSRLVQKFADEFDDTVFNPLNNLEDAQVSEDMIKRVSESEESLKALAEHSTEKAKEMGKLRAQMIKASAAAAKKKVADEAKAAKDKEAADKAKAKEAADKAKEKEAAAEKKEAAAEKPAKANASGNGSNGKKGEQPARKRERRPVEA